MLTTNLDTAMTISVIIPVHGAVNEFKQCLGSIAAAAKTFDEIIVVADADEAAARFAEKSGIQVIRTVKGPLGPARARNLGAEMASGDLLLFIDADVVVPPDIGKTVLSAFQRHPHAAALFGSYDTDPAETNFLSQYKNLLHHYVHQNAREVASTFWAACGAVRRDIFIQMQGFDEKFSVPSIEDIELGYRLNAAGHSILLVKTLQVKHLKHWCLRSLLKTDFFQRALPWSALILQKARFINDLNTKKSERFSVAACALLVLSPIFWPAAGALISIVPAALIAGLNWRLYRFFYRKRGLLFALGAVFWHGFYLFYSGIAFGMTVAKFLLGRDRFRVAYNPYAEKSR